MILPLKEEERQTRGRGKDAVDLWYRSEIRVQPRDLGQKLSILVPLSRGGSLDKEDFFKVCLHEIEIDGCICFMDEQVDVPAPPSTCFQGSDWLEVQSSLSGKYDVNERQSSHEHVSVVNGALY